MHDFASIMLLAVYGAWCPKSTTITSKALRMGIAVLVVLLAVTLHLLHRVDAKLTLRIRLASGVIQRFEVDDEDGITVADLRSKLRSSGVLTETDVSFTVNDKTYTCNDGGVGEDMTMKQLGVSNGDILNVIGPAADDTTTSGTSATSSASGSSGVKSASKFMQRKKKPTSIADLEKWRKELIKITRQKSTGGRSVSMTPSAGRILKRLASGHGHALLVGKVVSKGGKKSSSSGSGRKSVSIAAMAKAEQASKESVEVYAVCEVGNGEDLSTLPGVGEVCALASSLGLDVVGCCIGGIKPPTVASNTDGKESKGKESDPGKDAPVLSAWTADHVHATLQLRSSVSSTLNTAPNSTFVVVTVNEATTTPATDDATSTTDKKKKKSKKKSMTADGIALEAFQLSDQAHILYTKGILTPLKLPSPAESATGTGPNNKGGKGRDKSSFGAFKDKTAAQHEQGKVFLSGEILLQSTESRVVDPLLLAVPLPILPLIGVAAAAGTVAAKERGKGKKGGKGDKDSPPAPLSPLVDFEHSFPSAVEMNENSQTGTLAGKHFSQTLEGVNKPGTKRRFRDPHLLLHAARLLDKSTFAALCAALMSVGEIYSDKLPGMVQMALDMVRTTISGANGGKNSPGGKSSKGGNSKAQRSGAFVGEEDDDE